MKVERLQLPPRPKGKPRSVAGAGQSASGLRATPLTCGPGRPRYSTRSSVPRLPPKSESVREPARATPPLTPAPPEAELLRPRPPGAGEGERNEFSRRPVAVSLIGRGRGPRAGLGPCLQPPAHNYRKNWGGRCGEISYRSLGGAAGGAALGADCCRPGPSPPGGCGEEGAGMLRWGLPPLPLRLPRRSSTSSFLSAPSLPASLPLPLPLSHSSRCRGIDPKPTPS